ncbi:hypothetical protein FRB96_006366, partial [Tulasnella sp. 330]
MNRAWWGAKYQQRQKIALEYARFDSDDKAFIAAYSEANKTTTSLPNAITARNPDIKRRTSKNGSYSSRS